MGLPPGYFLPDAEYLSRLAIARSKPRKKRRKKEKKKIEKVYRGGVTMTPTFPTPPNPPSVRPPGGHNVPRVRMSTKALKVGNLCAGSSAHFYNIVYEGLLKSEPHFRFPSGKWSGGGPFYQYTASQQHIPAGYTTHLVNGTKWCGPVVGVSGVPTANWSSPVPPDMPSWDVVRSAADAHYATGRARTRPGNPVASVGQFLLELKDLPSVPFKRGIASARRPLSRSAGNVANVPKVLLKELSDFRNLGSEYLNVVFGWKPFVKDLQGMYNLWKTIDKQMAQLIRNNGKSIRRRARLKTESDSSQTRQSYNVPFANIASAPGYSGTGPAGTLWTVTTRWTEEVWFSGSYRYFIPDVGSSQWNRHARLALFGVLPTPELLWEVMPWSWLIDWFSNVGDVLSNASTNAVDNLVSDYAFVMRKLTYQKEAQATTWMGSSFVGNPMTIGRAVPAFSGTASSIQKWTLQSRSGGGNPFGLGIQLSALTGHQLSILAALGISRSKVN